MYRLTVFSYLSFREMLLSIALSFANLEALKEPHRWTKPAYPPWPLLVIFELLQAVIWTILISYRL